MKFGIILAGAALALLSAGAQAQVTITLTGTAPAAGGATAYAGTLTNTGSSTVTITSDTFDDPSSQVQFFDAAEGQFANTNDPNLAAYPQTLTGTSSGAAGHYDDNDLFELIVPAGLPLTPVTYTVRDSTGTTLGSVTFNVGGTAVPEPGSIALLMGGLVSGGMFVSRRRRK